MALALVLVIGSALLIRTFMKLQAVDPGFDTHNVLTMAMSISGDRFLKTSGVAQVIHDGTERINAVPGVTVTAPACCLPLQGGFGLPFNIVGRANGNNPNTGGAGYFPVSWSYFDVFKVPVVRGRNFTERDNGSAPGVVIINEAMARQFWRKGDPLNDRVVIGVGMGPVFVEPPRQVIGVVGDTRDGGLNQDPGPTMYIPVAQMPDKVTELNSRIAPLWWIVRTRMEPHTLTARRDRRDPRSYGRAAGGAHSQHGRDRRAYDIARTLQHAAAYFLRRFGFTDGGDRHLWINGVLGTAADTGTGRKWHWERRLRIFAIW
jgi:putative ABC transport system permease protein